MVCFQQRYQTAKSWDQILRFKTGTRHVNRRAARFSKLIEQPRRRRDSSFSFMTTELKRIR